jgi:hypothetical protein
MQETKEPSGGDDALFVKSLISTKVSLPYTAVGSNYLDIIKAEVAQQVEGKCIADGYIKRNSVEIVEYSAGKIDINTVEFQILYQCQVCLPVEGMLVHCKTKTITQKAGIHAECIVNGDPVLSVFITRDDNLQHPDFLKIKEIGIELTVRIVGVTFELNDPTITVIAALV